MITRIYVIQGPTSDDLVRYVGPAPSVAVKQRFPTTIVSIDVDETVPGLIDSLDEYMASIGYSPQV